MHSAAAILSTALAAVIVFVLPITSRRRYRALSAAGDDQSRRAALMRRSTVTKWSLAGVVLVIWALAGSAASVIWWGPYAVWVAVPLLVGMAVGGLRIRRMAVSPGHRAKLVRASRGFASLLPVTEAERRSFLGVAVTAGVVEEVLYRAFLIAYLHWLWPAGTALEVCVVAGLIFGLVHLYQGWRGVIVVAFLGIVLGVIYLAGGLIVVMALHTLIDLRLLLIPADVAAELAAAHPPEGSG